MSDEWTRQAAERKEGRCVSVGGLVYDLEQQPRELEADVARVFEEYWRPLVCCKDGALDEDQVKRELFDFYQVMSEVSKVYCHITGSRISKPNTHAVHVIAEADEHYQRIFEEDAKEREPREPSIVRGQAYAALCDRCSESVFEPVFDFASQTWIHGADTTTSGVTIPAEECQANALRLLWQCARSEP